jgi:hypothetical protein
MDTQVGNGVPGYNYNLDRLIIPSNAIAGHDTFLVYADSDIDSIARSYPFTRGNNCAIFWNDSLAYTSSIYTSPSSPAVTGIYVWDVISDWVYKEEPVGYYNRERSAGEHWFKGDATGYFHWMLSEYSASGKKAKIFIVKNNEWQN